MMICQERSAIRLVKTSAMCQVSFLKASLKPSSRLGYEGLKRLSDRLAIQVQVIQSLSELNQPFLQSLFMRGLALSLVGEQMWVKGAAAPWATPTTAAATAG